MEYIAFIGVMLVLFALASYAALSANNSVQDENDVADARNIAYLAAQEINVAVEVGDGYSHTFAMPQTLGSGYIYNVTFSPDRFVYVFWGSNYSYSLPTIASSISGNFSKGANTIRNSNGVISIG